MSDTTQTILRSILKIGAGYLISKGIVDGSGAEVLISSILGAGGVVWGIMHRTPKA